jgi:nicotinate-nucleotide pyrophosphorylase (carboxylating)
MALLKMNLTTLVERALREDVPSGDHTTLCCVPAGASGQAEITAKEDGIIAGLPVAEVVFKQLESSLLFEAFCSDGARVAPGEVVARISGKLRPILTGERTALNFLQRLSGIATMTAAWVEEIREYKVRLADTRKTTPGLRQLEKYAVRLGGGINHRFDLSGGILIKENHIRCAGGIKQAVQAARSAAPFTLQVEVEVTDLQELEQALDVGADIIMLDNMTTGMMRKAVEIAGGRAILEASGNVTFERLKEIAATGVDLISCGAITHSCSALDLSLLVR